MNVVHSARSPLKGRFTLIALFSGAERKRQVRLNGR
jgi:hypothetical protein